MADKVNKKHSRLSSLCQQAVAFVVIFFVTFVGLHYWNNYKTVAHCHILSPLKEEFGMYPEYKKFFERYQKKFNIAFRRVGEEFIL